ncbi:4-(cytidine 5'-diphospho)-2-C-methyl-D-erythritol kinase [Meridianimarinicoccus sp. RP-17]|uniref:4-(cytidine 5'-diphospho)-2-C-methyl-D-erythritol kinase n=1 Tax=Meridianimarinicoccus zhengii TaxID=2056810 RepID=UPI001F2AEBA5|nr:4-(cytidine 5'-diphospho)-2-C-methyl-D-erythritol kinase [Phycocomes zhengii]
MLSPGTVEALAPAKINLALHVVGQRADGYHLIDSLVVFVGHGDILVARAAPVTTLRIDGPLAAGVPTGPENLVLRAAALFDPPVTSALRLTKRLPAAAGIGGGSSDAAACLRLLAEIGGRALPDAESVLSLGADLPACLAGYPLRMTGIGEQLAPLEPLPPFWAVLVNPGVAVDTGAVYRGLERRDGGGIAPQPAVDGTLDWLREQRNDLQPPALALAPVIGDVLDLIGMSDGCALSRMSGSGATCFGLFADADAAVTAAEWIGKARSDWWCVAAPVLTAPQAIRATT